RLFFYFCRINRREMKLNTLFVVGVCAATFLGSCSPKTAEERQLNLTHTSLVDGDAYQFFQLVGAKTVYENDYASYAAGVANSSQAKQVAAKSQEVYSSLIPALDSLAIIKHIDFPVKGSAQFAAPSAVTTVETEQEDIDTAAVEDAAVAQQASAAVAAGAYTLHVRHEEAVGNDALKRLARDTDIEVRAFAAANLHKVAGLFTLAGGQEDAPAPQYASNL